MESLKNYKMPIITIIVVVCVLLFFVAFGETLYLLSSNPDGLEKTLLDAGTGEPESAIAPLLGFLENDFVIAIIGIILIVMISIAIFYLVAFLKNKRNQ